MLARLTSFASPPDGSASDDDKAFAIFRIGISLSVLVKALSYYLYLDLLYGEFGMVQRPIADAVSKAYIPTTFAIADVLRGWGFDSAPVTETVLGINVVSAVAMGLGWHARASAICCWVSTAILMSTANVFNYGVDHFQLMGLFYCSLFAIDRAWSIRPRKLRVPTETSASWLPIWILRLHVCLVYFSAGFWKLSGEQWWDGNAMWRALVQPIFLHQPFSSFDLQTLAQFRILFLLGGLGVAFTQVAFPVLVFIKQLRPFILVTMILFHVSIGLFLGLYLFSFTLIVYDVAAFYDFSSGRFKNLGSYVRKRLSIHRLARIRKWVSVRLTDRRVQ